MCRIRSEEDATKYNWGGEAEDIMLDNLLTEMEKTAVEKQSDLLNKVQLMENKQELDEPVRSYVARPISAASL